MISIKNLNNVEILPEGTTVKKAYLVHHLDTKIYSLIHYETEILTVSEDKKIIKALQCSSSSTRAIYQVANYLDLDRDEIKKHMVPFSNFYKYPVGN